MKWHVCSTDPWSRPKCDSQIQFGSIRQWKGNFSTRCHVTHVLPELSSETGTPCRKTPGCSKWCIETSVRKFPSSGMVSCHSDGHPWRHRRFNIAYRRCCRHMQRLRLPHCHREWLKKMESPRCV